MTLLAVATGYVMLLAAPAWAAAGGSVPLARSAWFHTTVANQVSAPAGLPVAEPTGVPAGDDAVAFTADQTGASSKETVLQFALPHDAASSTITAFTVSMSLDSSPTAPQAAAGGSPIDACLPTRGWSTGAAQDSTGQPTVDCSNAVAGVWKGSTVTFSIARLAQSWVDDTNLGVALVNNPKNKTQPFQAIFAGGKRISATLRYTPATTGTTKPPRHHHSTPPPTTHHHHAPTQLGGGATTTPSIPNVGVPNDGTTVSTGPGAQSPLVATTAPSGAGAVQPDRSASLPGQASSLPPKGFWVVAACLMILLVGAALALDEVRPRTPARTGSGRLDRLLHDPKRLATFTARSQP